MQETKAPLKQEQLFGRKPRFSNKEAFLNFMRNKLKDRKVKAKSKDSNTFPKRYVTQKLYNSFRGNVKKNLLVAKKYYWQKHFNSVILNSLNIKRKKYLHRKMVLAQKRLQETIFHKPDNSTEMRSQVSRRHWLLILKFFEFLRHVDFLYILRQIIKRFQKDRRQKIRSCVKNIKYFQKIVRGERKTL